MPHTRPVSITGIASDESLLQRLGYDRTSYEGPTGIVGVLHHACAEAGPRVGQPLGLGAALRGRRAQPKVALALVRAFEGTAGVVVDAGELETAAEDYERQVTAAVASDPEVKAFVERLESAMDEVGATSQLRGGPALGGHDRERLPALPAPARARVSLGPHSATQRRTGADGARRERRTMPYFSAAGQMIR